MYKTTRESVKCACGGSHSMIPDIIRRHRETKKHQEWVRCQMMKETQTPHIIVIYGTSKSKADQHQNE